MSACGLAFSYVLACATPFAAIAAIASVTLKRRDGIAVVAATWLGNQAVGYLLLGYPREWDSFAWGGVIGLAAGTALATDFALARLKFGPVVTALVALLVGFCAYEIVLFIATLMLPSGDDAFSLAVIAQILRDNIVAFAGLMAIYAVIRSAGFLEPAGKATPPRTL
ncbi:MULTISPECIES: hypothetical protein [unclassified Rhizobium]|uniref:hypothetical protein n=1 Tax=unclassified Rhizobium TaxID=2613769 RepID=UPI000690B8D4|nr:MULTISPECIES: hypothetical protein [unclassified Rhizobium]MBN8953619.1 hypothetical protein [Rhizobium tropici]